MSFNSQIKETAKMAREISSARFAAFESDAENQKALDEMEQEAKHQGYWLEANGVRIEVAKYGRKMQGWSPESVAAAVAAVNAGYRHA